MDIEFLPQHRRHLHHGLERRRQPIEPGDQDGGDAGRNLVGYRREVVGGSLGRLCAGAIAQLTNLFAIPPLPCTLFPISYEQAALAQIQRQLLDKKGIAIGLSSQEGRQLVGDRPAEHMRCQRANTLRHQRV